MHSVTAQAADSARFGRMSVHAPDRAGTVRPVTYEFDLVPEQGELQFDNRGFEKASYLLCEFQPATRVTLVGDPPSRVRVVAEGMPAAVAPGILAQVEALAGARLQYQLVD